MENSQEKSAISVSAPMNSLLFFWKISAVGTLIFGITTIFTYWFLSSEDGFSGDAFLAIVFVPFLLISGLFSPPNLLLIGVAYTVFRNSRSSHYVDGVVYPSPLVNSFDVILLLLAIIFLVFYYLIIIKRKLSIPRTKKYVFGQVILFSVVAALFFLVGWNGICEFASC